MYFLLIFIFILINFPVEAKNSCNDECLTKTYCISSDGSGVCSHDNLVTAQFKMLPVFGKYDYIQLTLKGYNLVPEDEKTIKVRFQRSPLSSSIYTCYKSPLGSTYARYDDATYQLVTGSSYYMDRVLNCTWTFNIYDKTWPLGIDLLKESSQSIKLYDDSKEVTVVQNTTQLPIYHAQYLKCCNKVHGNDAFVITFEQTEKQIRYQLYYWKYQNNEVTVILTRKDGIQLRFECYRTKVVKGYIINVAERISVNQPVSKATVINGEICSWATPFVLGDSRISIDASTSVFDLQVEVESITIYTEKGVILKNSSHLAKLSFILIAFAVLFQIALIRP